MKGFWTDAKPNMVDDVRGYRWNAGYGPLVYDREGRLIDNNDAKKACIEYKRKNFQATGKYKRNQCKATRPVLCVTTGKDLFRIPWIMKDYIHFVTNFF